MVTSYVNHCRGCSLWVSCCLSVPSGCKDGMWELVSDLFGDGFVIWFLVVLMSVCECEWVCILFFVWFAHDCRCWNPGLIVFLCSYILRTRYLLRIGQEFQSTRLTVLEQFARMLPWFVLELILLARCSLVCYVGFSVSLVLPWSFGLNQCVCIEVFGIKMFCCVVVCVCVCVSSLVCDVIFQLTWQFVDPVSVRTFTTSSNSLVTYTACASSGRFGVMWLLLAFVLKGTFLMWMVATCTNWATVPASAQDRIIHQCVFRMLVWTWIVGGDWAPRTLFFFCWPSCVWAIEIVWCSQWK